MPKLYRAMRHDIADGMPSCAPAGRDLGVRPGEGTGTDDLLKAEDGLIHPCPVVRNRAGGMSVTLGNPRKIPNIRRPGWLNGRGTDILYVLETAQVGADLRFRLDLDSRYHGVLEVARPMGLADYQRALCRTRLRWIVIEPKNT